ncbi:phage head-tail connector protein [Clostridiaceae bacterium UIB06]|uniref:Phage head-tail connector protein n=1 Tax=Clostridium thailandense TaxID=2794346 RepID=A0A949U312_9CLOT|nr:phage head-tail connector protein [Clostridium thailandense]MBV7275444.1 phage head-tail connector protein [Clostridium thailandense]MCH5136695.1 phage head-tail connector protein [Clostridiaceae bacterium UIB06]
MLENIKLVLGITDNSKDELIKYYISRVSQRVQNYCGDTQLKSEYEGIVEELVIKDMQGKNDIRYERIGDYYVEYNVHEDLLAPYQSQLRKSV